MLPETTSGEGKTKAILTPRLCLLHSVIIVGIEGILVVIIPHMSLALLGSRFPHLLSEASPEDLKGPPQRQSSLRITSILLLICTDYTEFTHGLSPFLKEYL